MRERRHIDATATDPQTERITRAGLIFFGIYAGVTGLWSYLAPASFYDQVARYGLENHHYLGDAGSYSIAFGVMLLLAVGRPGWRVPLLVVGAAWFALHSVNHFLDIGEARSTERGVADAVLLLIGAAGHAALAVLSRRTTPAGARTAPPLRSPVGEPRGAAR